VIDVEFAEGIRRTPLTAPCAVCAEDTTHELVWIARGALPDVIALHSLERPQRQQSMHLCPRCLDLLRKAPHVTEPGPTVIAWGLPLVIVPRPCQVCTEVTQSVLVWPATFGREHDVADYKLTSWCGRCLWALQRARESAHSLLPALFAPPV